MADVALGNHFATDMRQVHVDDSADKVNNSLNLVATAQIAFINFDEFDGAGMEHDITDFEVNLLILQASDAFDPPPVSNILENRIDHVHYDICFVCCHYFITIFIVLSLYKF